MVQFLRRLGGSSVQVFDFFSRARGARVQDFHWPLEGPGFRFFTGFLCFPPMVQFLRRLGGSGVQVFAFFFTGSRGQGSGFSLFLFFTGSRGQGSGFSLASRGQGSVFHWRRRPSKALRPQGSGFSPVHGLEGPGFGFFTGVGGPGFRFFTGFGRPNKTSRASGPQDSIFHCFFFLRPRRARVRVFHCRRGARVRFFTGLGDLVRT